MHWDLRKRGSHPSILEKWSHILEGSSPPLLVTCWVSICVWGGAAPDGGMGDCVFGWLASARELGAGSVEGVEEEAQVAVI